ncbi:MAG TPA: winged helix-turn-helix transcriptional regulator [Nitrososphaeraceae archaeon]
MTCINNWPVITLYSTPPRVEYSLIVQKGQELVESVIDLQQWMRKWSSTKQGSQLKLHCYITIFCCRILFVFKPTL